MSLSGNWLKKNQIKAGEQNLCEDKNCCNGKHWLKLKNKTDFKTKLVFYHSVLLEGLKKKKKGHWSI